MRLNYDSKNWNWIVREIGSIEIASLVTKEGYVLKDFDDVVYYLADVVFANDYVYWECVREAVVKCATELGCLYQDVYELADDIRNYYI